MAPFSIPCNIYFNKANPGHGQFCHYSAEHWGLPKSQFLKAKGINPVISKCHSGQHWGTLLFNKRKRFLCTPDFPQHCTFAEECTAHI